MSAPTEQLDAEFVAAIMAGARRNPVDGRLPPNLSIQLAHLRQNLDGEVHALGVVATGLAVLIVPAVRDAADPIGDWTRIDVPFITVLAAARETEH